MQFIGSSVWSHGGVLAFKVRNKLGVYVAPSRNFLDKYRDFRYFEFYQDFSGRVHIRRPAGTQELLDKPYTLIKRTPKGDGYDLVSQEVT